MGYTLFSRSLDKEQASFARARKIPEKLVGELLIFYKVVYASTKM